MKLMRLAVTVLFVAVWVFPGPALAGDRVLFYHNDALGSPVVMTDATGNVAWRADYEPFGEISALVDTLQAPNTHQFIGKEADPETSLHYLGARYYDGNIGRFLSLDPALVGGQPASAVIVPQRLNLYVYSTNNPYRYLDPSGKIPQLVIEAYNWASLGLSLFAYQSDPSFSNGLAIGLDLIGVASLGNLPALGITVRGAGAIEKSATAAKNINKIEGAVPNASKAEKSIERNISGGQSTVEQALQGAEKWLGAGYKQIAPGVYRSKDGSRQFRMTNSDLTDPKQGPHVHFESIGPDGRFIIENSHVVITN